MILIQSLLLNNGVMNIFRNNPQPTYTLQTSRRIKVLEIKIARSKQGERNVNILRNHFKETGTIFMMLWLLQVIVFPLNICHTVSRAPLRCKGIRLTHQALSFEATTLPLVADILGCFSGWLWLTPWGSMEPLMADYLGSLFLLCDGFF